MMQKSKSKQQQLPSSASSQSTTVTYHYISLNNLFGDIIIFSDNALMKYI